MAEYVKFSDIVDPQYAKVKNDIQYARTNQNPGTQVFTYMESCPNSTSGPQPSVLWGSGNKPIDEVCLPNKLHMEGASCNSIWNNSTKRKTIANLPIYPTNWYKN
jgi:hypothetical protein